MFAAATSIVPEWVFISVIVFSLGLMLLMFVVDFVYRQYLKSKGCICPHETLVYWYIPKCPYHYPNKSDPANFQPDPLDPFDYDDPKDNSPPRLPKRY